MDYNTVFNKLKENSGDVTDETIRILLKIADNIIKDPTNLKWRTLQKENQTIKNKILSSKGGVDCLKLMGFQETTSSFVNPTSVTPNKLQVFKTALTTWASTRSEHKNSNTQKSSHTDMTAHSSTPEKREEIIERVKLSPLVLTFSNPYLRSLEMHSHMVKQYEHKGLQERAKKLLPLPELEIEAQVRLRAIQKHVKTSKAEDPEISIQDTMLLALLKWFKGFFEWVDSPACEKCGKQTSMSHMSYDKKLLVYTDRVEIHKCLSCGAFTPFPRYNDVNILLETRRGRCGEWANTFTLFCRAMGWDARFVVCEGDHVWSEVYSITQKRWLHCDPCENICDTPLIYENGWNKQMSYVMAYSAEEIQDVTWRYSSKHKEVLARRNKCTESELLDSILKIRSKLLSEVSPTRKEYLTKRTVLELVEFLVEKKPGEEDQKGRISGASAWRLARKEIAETNEERKHVWVVNNDDIVGDSVTLKYSAALNRYEYISGDKKIKDLVSWNEGAYEHKLIFRKEEKDWNMVYLARNEGEENGKISWKIDLSHATRQLDKVTVRCKFQTYENGIVNVSLQSEENNSHLSLESTTVTTNKFCNAKELLLEASLSGGKGDVAWQHSQLFRQSLNDTTEYPLSITLTFI